MSPSHPWPGSLRPAERPSVDNPVFWTRLVGYAYLCQQFIEATGTELGFTRRSVDVAALLATVDDPAIASQIGGQKAIFQAIVDEGL